MGQLQYAPRHYVHWLQLRNTVVWPIHTAGRGVNSTTIQCDHEQSLISCFICSQWITYVQIVTSLMKYRMMCENTRVQHAFHCRDVFSRFSLLKLSFSHSASENRRTIYSFVSFLQMTFDEDPGEMPHDAWEYASTTCVSLQGCLFRDSHS